MAIGVRCAVCEHVFEENDEYLIVRVWEKAKTEKDSFFDSAFGEHMAYVCGKPHALEWLETNI